MFDSLSERLRKTLSDLTGRGRVSEADVDAAMREIRLSLLEAVVNFKVVKDFIARGGVEAARRLTRDVVILDTAGRLTVDQELMDEIAGVNAAVKPVETLLVVDAMAGQEAVNVATAFRDAVPLTGLILTKIDGDARGGAALSISAVTGLAVKFMGTGEKTDALEVFHPDRLAGRILGMGDVMTLVERAQEHVDAAQAARLEEKLRKAQFTLEDFLEQIQAVQKMGPMGQLMSMIPGMGGMAKQAQEAVDRGDLRRVEAIIRSMTPRERRDPTILNGSRRRRIAAGAGADLTEVNRLIKQHAELSKLMKQLSGGGRKAAMAGLVGRR
jgi:signal recognition particle subunit SRP54